MLGYYRYDDLDGGIIAHATWLIDAAKSFSSDQRKRNATSVVLANVDMAEAWAGQGMNDQAIALLRRKPRPSGATRRGSPRWSIPRSRDWNSSARRARS